MFWNKITKNMGIKRKVFFASIFIIIIGFLLLYLTIYILLPEVYKRYKISTVENEVSDFIEKLSTDNITDINKEIDDFAIRNGINIKIEDKNGESIYSSLRDDFKFEPMPESNDRKENIFPDRPKKIREDLKNRDHTNIEIKDEFYFKSINKKCVITASSFIRVKEESKRLIVVFFPFAAGTIIIIAVTIGYFYAKIISKPLLEINDKAKKMSNLDFSQKLYPKGNDEISQLSTSLNIMSDRLEENIYQLESANEKLQKDIEKEREAQKERKEFIATISHELKSPITIIAGQLEGMIYGIGKYKDREKYLKETYEVTQEMQKLVMQILELSKREKDDFKINKGYFNISAIINKCIRDNYYFIEDKNLELITDIDEFVEVLGDEKLLNKVIVNIIRNAIWHSPEKEKIIIIVNKNEIIIRNTGVMIEQKEINNIFNAFYRIDKSRNSNTGGTGLGLYIVKSILDKHDNLEYGIVSQNNYVEFYIKIS